MQPKAILDTAKILILAIARTFAEWVAIIAIGAGITILCFTFGGPDIDATMVKPGTVEVIIGGSYVLTTTFSIWNASVKNRAFYFLIMGISIAIATVAVLLFKGFFVFCLFLGSVAMWYQIILTQLRPATTTPD